MSIPVSDREMEWIARIGGPWRKNRDGLFRQSNVELALVTESVWKRWHLPDGGAPILTLDTINESELSKILAEGAQVARPTEMTEWGVPAGFVRFPSGVLLEVKPNDGRTRE